MFDDMELLDIDTHLPRFQRFFRDYSNYEETTYRIHAYVTFNQACPCNCSFCRNKQFSCEMKQTNLAKMRKTLKLFSPYIHTITFGGGEPLLFLDDLVQMVNDVYRLDGVWNGNQPRRYMITSGLRDDFTRNISKIFSFYRGDEGYRGAFNSVYLTRQRVEDVDNQKAFNTNIPILGTQDLQDLENIITRNIEIVSTCYKNGGIESFEEVMELIYWTAYIGSEYVIFNDLQFDVTDPEYYNEHQISDDMFEKSIECLRSRGFKEKIEVCFSGGYNIRMYFGKICIKKNLFRKEYRYIHVGFKQYHKPRTTLEHWKEATKRTFDLSIMPSGEIFTDWANQKPVDNI